MHKQRRNLNIISLVIIVLDLANFKIDKIPIPFAKSIESESLNYLGLESFNILLFFIFIYIMFRYISYLSDYYEDNSIKEKGNFVYKKKVDKYFDSFVRSLDFLLNRKLYDIYIPMFLAGIVFIGYMLSFISDVHKNEDPAIWIFFGVFMIIIILISIIFGKISRFYFNEKLILKKQISSYKFIQKDEKNIKTREMYNKKKEKILIRKVLKFK